MKFVSHYSQTQKFLNIKSFGQTSSSRVILQFSNIMEQSTKNMMYFITIDQHPQWENQIKQFLMKFANRQIAQEDIVKALRFLRDKYCYHRHQFIPYGRKPKVIDFKIVEKLYKNDLPDLLKDLAEFLINFKPAKIPILRSQFCRKVQIRKGELFYMVVMMFMQLVPEQHYDRFQFKGRFNDVNNFGHIMSYSQFKTRCIVEYLKKTMIEIKKNGEMAEKCIVIRNSVNFTIQMIIQGLSNTPMTRIKIESNNSSIEEFHGQLKVDFANRFIGGGCLKNGCVQQQIMFAIRPELYPMTLICQKMDVNQALSFVGFKRYFDYDGYGDKTKYAGPANVKYDTINYDKVVLYDESIIAIDAIKFKAKDPVQFSQEMIDREIYKAYAGFSSIQTQAKIITGGWGCGVYNGDFTLKVAIQWIAATMAGKKLVICPFGRKDQLQNTGLLKIFSDLRLEQAYKLLINAGNIICKDRLNLNIAQIMVKILKKSRH